VYYFFFHAGHRPAPPAIERDLIGEDATTVALLATGPSWARLSTPIEHRTF
jgi:hypothetical protein